MYFITTIEDFNEHSTKHSRCVGYFSDLNRAKEVLTENQCDLFETIYNYAVIEKVAEGLYQYDLNPLWFKWSREEECYKEIDKPKEARNIVGFGIG